MACQVGKRQALGCRATRVDRACHPPANSSLSFPARDPYDAIAACACARRPARSSKGLKATVNRAREIWRGNSFLKESQDAPQEAASDQVPGIHPDLIARNLNLAPADHQV